jgi:hypothetical protein
MIDGETRNLHRGIVVIEIFKTRLLYELFIARVYYDLTANECYITYRALGLRIEGGIRTGQTLTLVCMRMSLEEDFQGSKRGVAKPQPGKAITGLNLAHAYR